MLIGLLSLAALEEKIIHQENFLSFCCRRKKLFYQPDYLKTILLLQKYFQLMLHKRKHSYYEIQILLALVEK